MTYVNLTPSPAAVSDKIPPPIPDLTKSLKTTDEMIGELVDWCQQIQMSLDDVIDLNGATSTGMLTRINFNNDERIADIAALVKKVEQECAKWQIAMDGAKVDTAPLEALYRDNCQNIEHLARVVVSADERSRNAIRIAQQLPTIVPATVIEKREIPIVKTDWYLWSLTGCLVGYQIYEVLQKFGVL